MIENIGSAGVFIAGSRIVAGLLAHHPMFFFSKTGIIGGIGSGFTITYRILTHTMSHNITNSSFSNICKTC